MEINFPLGFLWGAATSSHQVEGGNINDWSQWEKNNAERLASEAKNKWQSWQQEKFPAMFELQNYISSQACDHYNRWQEDFDMAKSLGHNAHRFSLEWSRIEPKKGEFDQAAIDHYSQMISGLGKRGMEPFVTINHFSLPQWFANMGGWESQEAVLCFGKFVDHLAKTLGHQITFWLTLNEPWIYIVNSYWRGVWPPQKRSWWRCLRVYKNLFNAHKTAYNIIKSYHPEAQVGLAENNVYFEGWLSGPAHWLVNRQFLSLSGQRLDFIGVNYYFHNKIKGFNFRKNDNHQVSDLGWELYPKGLFYVLRRLKKYRKPIYITEGGLADARDLQRANFIKSQLFYISEALAEGVDVRGYFYWSLLDNFEWDKGFWPRFGLAEIDYKTQERKIRSSAWEYAKICKENKLII
ncbi:MAG TPA: family 1 glycosylhydrolase [Candidatus Portnoybacteria bacterium]|nr:family 1 glycosylhydrolase [Candidatus Portnoybacteria bacterium]